MSVIISEPQLLALKRIQRKAGGEYHHRSPDWEWLLKQKKRRMAMKARIAGAAAQLDGGIAAAPVKLPIKQMSI